MNQNNKPIDKIMILGAGRAGTTFLLQLLTELGEDTGVEERKESIKWDWIKEHRAGLEANVPYSEDDDEMRENLAKTPRILKGPVYSLWLKDVIKRGVLNMEHIFIPIRDLTTAVKSRFDVGLGISGTDDPVTEENSLASLIGKAIESAIIFDIPYTFMKFPDLVLNEDYCFKKLSECFKINRKEFSKAFKKCAKPEIIKFQ